MFKNNMIFTKAACWVNSKISNRDKNITFITFLCHYCFVILMVQLLKVFKVGLSPSKKNYCICFNESPLKVMENAFYFTLKTLLVLKIFKFFCWLFGHVKNQHGFTNRSYLHGAILKALHRFQEKRAHKSRYK